MGLSRRQFTKEFKLAAVRRLEQGVSIGEAARALEVNPNVLHRWRREFRQGTGNAQSRSLSERQSSVPDIRCEESPRTAAPSCDRLSLQNERLGRYPGREWMRYFLPGSLRISTLMLRKPSLGFGWG